jgi:hypothetical protein
MRHEITKLESPLRASKRRREYYKSLWGLVQPEDWRYLTECLTCTIGDVITAKGSRADFS